MCSDDGTEHLGLVYGRCQWVTVKLRAWGWCGHCGVMLLKRVPSGIRSLTLLVNWETEYAAEVINTLLVAQREDCSAIKSVLTRDQCCIPKPHCVRLKRCAPLSSGASNPWRVVSSLCSVTQNLQQPAGCNTHLRVPEDPEPEVCKLFRGGGARNCGFGVFEVRECFLGP